MIKPLSGFIVSYLIRVGAIKNTKDDQEYYQYGVEITISSLLNIILIIGLGIILHKFLFALVFLMIFISLRQLTGGFHASSYLKCNISMCIVFLFDIYTNELFYNNKTLLLFISHLLLSSIIILKCCPIEHINKPIPPQSIGKYKISALLLSDSLSIIGWILSINDFELGTFIIMTIISIFILVIVAMLIRKEDVYES